MAKQKIKQSDEWRDEIYRGHVIKVVGKYRSYIDFRIIRGGKVVVNSLHGGITEAYREVDRLLDKQRV